MKKKWEPEPLINMAINYPQQTICQTIREIYWLAEKLPVSNERMTIQYKARIAANMANRMSNKLREYKADYDKNWWEEASNE